MTDPLTIIAEATMTKPTITQADVKLVDDIGTAWHDYRNYWQMEDCDKAVANYEACKMFAARHREAAIAEAKTEGRREGLDEAVQACRDVESPFDHHSHTPEDCAFYNATEACESAIRNLITKGRTDD